MTALLAIGVLVFGQPVSVDTEAAAAALQYLADLNTGRSWPKGAVQEMYAFLVIKLSLPTTHGSIPRSPRTRLLRHYSPSKKAGPSFRSPSG